MNEFFKHALVFTASVVGMLAGIYLGLLITGGM
jgi:hypothetical protein